MLSKGLWFRYVKAYQTKLFKVFLTCIRQVGIIVEQINQIALSFTEALSFSKFKLKLLQSVRTITQVGEVGRPHLA